MFRILHGALQVTPYNEYDVLTGRRIGFGSHIFTVKLANGNKFDYELNTLATLILPQGVDENINVITSTIELLRPNKVEKYINEILSFPEYRAWLSNPILLREMIRIYSRFGQLQNLVNNLRLRLENVNMSEENAQKQINDMRRSSTDNLENVAGSSRAFDVEQMIQNDWVRTGENIPGSSGHGRHQREENAGRVILRNNALQIAHLRDRNEIRHAVNVGHLNNEEAREMRRARFRERVRRERGGREGTSGINNI